MFLYKYILMTRIDLRTSDADYLNYYEEKLFEITKFNSFFGVVIRSGIFGLFLVKFWLFCPNLLRRIGYFTEFLSDPNVLSNFSTRINPCYNVREKHYLGLIIIWIMSSTLPIWFLIKQLYTLVIVNQLFLNVTTAV